MVKLICINVYEFLLNSLLGYWYAFKKLSRINYDVMFYTGKFVIYAIGIIIVVIGEFTKYNVMFFTAMYYLFYPVLVLMYYLLKPTLFITKWICIILGYIILGYLLMPFYLFRFFLRGGKW